MFSIEQIKAAHAHVKSGADYPNYVQELIKLGVTAYETYVSDGSNFYTGRGDHKVQSGEKYAALEIAGKSDKALFQKGLLEHQQGKTDFPAFCRMSAQTGVEKWVVDLKKMTCTYYDKTGDELLVETIPQP